MTLPAFNFNKEMMKHSLQQIFIILCFIFFYTFNMTCVLKATGKEKVEMIVTVKLSPEIEAPYRTVQKFLYNKRTEIFLKISNITNSF